MKDETLIRYIQGISNAEETRMVMEWIDASKENEKHVLEMQHLFNTSLGWDSIFEELEASKTTHKKTYHLQWKKIGAIAASLFIFFIGGWMLAWNTIQNKIAKHTPLAECIQVPAKQRLNLTLADGTEVCLNANSTLRFNNDWNQKERRVTLDGEAYFKVAHDKKRPFIVETNTYDIQVLGTTFNVNAYKKDGNFKVSLLEGAVQINDKEEHKLLQLAPNEEAVLNNGYLAIHQTKNKDQFRWKDGILAFNNESYGEIFKKLETYYNIDIAVEKTQINQYRVTAKFYMDSGLDHILNILKQFNKFNYSWNEKNNKIIIN